MPVECYRSGKGDVGWRQLPPCWSTAIPTRTCGSIAEAHPLADTARAWRLNSHFLTSRALGQARR